MKVRYSVNEAGELVDRDGNSLGRITSITLEEAGGTTGGVEVEHPVNSRTDGSGRKKKNPLTPEIEEVWAHYVQVFNAGRQTLNEQRLRVIRQALKVRTVGECKRAIDGLRVSEHHNGGPNGTGTKYLDIRYALKGNSQAGESPEARIDTMIDTADRNAPPMIDGATLPPDHHKVQRALREVRYTVSTEGEKSRGRAAFDRLVAWGYKPRRLDAAPWVALDR